MSRRKVEVCVISDVHLGTYGSRAEEVLQYLRSIKPKTLILNGDIIDVWQFKKKYWPSSHTKVIKEILNLATKGCRVVYLPGNHDELFRRFVGLSLANIEIENKAILELDGKKAWFFHGDVFDITMQHSRWLAKIGSVGYDSLIWLNYRVNQFLSLIGKEKKSFSKSIKNGVKSAVKYINKFEDLCADLAIEHGYHFVVCGHIHQPIIREVKNGKGSVSYLNSGDWVENLTALEYNKKKWEIINFSELNFDKLVEPADFLMDSKQEELFSKILQEFKMVESE